MTTPSLNKVFCLLTTKRRSCNSIGTKCTQFALQHFLQQPGSRINAYSYTPHVTSRGVMSGVLFTNAGYNLLAEKKKYLN